MFFTENHRTRPMLRLVIQVSITVQVVPKYARAYQRLYVDTGLRKCRRTTLLHLIQLFKGANQNSSTFFNRSELIKPAARANQLT